MSVHSPLLCKNCKYLTPSEASPKDPEMSRCTFERPISLVTGLPKQTQDLPFCDMDRRSSGRCGPLAANYLPLPINDDPESIIPLTVEETQELLAGDPRNV
jgi:hypothetical protein